MPAYPWACRSMQCAEHAHEYMSMAPSLLVVCVWRCVWPCRRPTPAWPMFFEKGFRGCHAHVPVSMSFDAMRRACSCVHEHGTLVIGCSKGISTPIVFLFLNLRHLLHLGHFL